MRRPLNISLVVLVSLALLVAWAVVPAPTAADPALKATKHDFTTTGPSTTFRDAGASWCSTCHTPHSGRQTQLMWNQSFSTNTTIGFPASTTTVAGTSLPTDIKDWSGTTKLCLSCHDGSVEVGTLAHDAWTTPAKITNTDRIVGSGGNLLGTHPVGVPYPATGTEVYNGITTKATTTDFVASPSSVKIFTDPGTSGKGIECASCHDPHNKAVPATPVKFLRVAVADLCTTCHQK